MRGRTPRGQGYAAAVDEATPRLVTAAYECRDCGSTDRRPANAGTRPDPGACDDCRSDAVRFDAADSAFVDCRRVRLAALPESDDTGSIAVELSGDLLDRIDRGDRLDVAGVLDVRPVDEGFERVLEVTHPTRLDPAATDLFDGPYLGVPADDTLDEASTDDTGSTPDETPLDAVVDRSRAVLADRDLNDRETREKVVAPVLHALGWTPTLPAVHMGTTPPGASSVQTIDYALGGDDGARVVVCVERPAQSLGTVGDRLRTAMRTTGATLGLLTNGHQYQFFVSEADAPGEVCVLTCSLGRLSDHPEILRAFSRDRVGDAEGAEAFADLVAESRDRDLRVETDADPEAFDLADRITSTIDLIEQQTTDEGAPIERVFAVLKADQELADAVDHEVTDDVLLNHVGRLRDAGRVQSVRDGFLRTT
ncbi:hypothetical protein [Salinirarus marinus]|uniref:hypothetical protein n=1 Tax=Salinirarus marinus TaxID=3068310 RepID=UPI003C6BDB8E